MSASGGAFGRPGRGGVEGIGPWCRVAWPGCNWPSLDFDRGQGAARADAHPHRRRRVRRPVRGARPSTTAAQRRGRPLSGQPPLLHDVPTLSSRSGLRLDRAAPCAGAAADRAQARATHHRYGSGPGPRSPDGHGRADRRTSLRAGVRRRGGGPRIRVEGPAGARPCRASGRVQDRHRSDLPSQSGAVEDGRGRVHGRPEPATAGSDVPVRGRRLCRRGGPGRAGGSGPRRLPLLPERSASDMRWVLVEAANGILPEIGSDLGEYAVQRLRRRDIEVHLRTKLESAEGGRMILSTGESFEADTLVWTTGVRAHPAVARMGFPLDERGRVLADEFLRVRDVLDAWTAGDCASVPDIITGGVTPPTAQHALRQAKQLARNVAATLRGRGPQPFRYRQLGALVSLGRYKGVARVMGIRLRGFPAWFLHRTYHLSRIPTANRKVRVVLDWTVALFFRRDVVQLGSLQHPRDPLREARES